MTLRSLRAHLMMEGQSQEGEYQWSRSQRVRQTCCVVVVMAAAVVVVVVGVVVVVALNRRVGGGEPVED